MTQRDLNRAVARATGETVDRVGRLGFHLTIVPGPVLHFVPPTVPTESSPPTGQPILTAARGRR